jgi:hypothetical protein
MESSTVQICNRVALLGQVLTGFTNLLHHSQAQEMSEKNVAGEECGALCGLGVERAPICSLTTTKNG